MNEHARAVIFRRLLSRCAELRTRLAPSDKWQPSGAARRGYGLQVCNTQITQARLFSLPHTACCNDCASDASAVHAADW